MVFRIYFTKDDYEDYFEIEEDSIEEIQLKVKEESEKRRLDQDKNNMYSQRII